MSKIADLPFFKLHFSNSGDPDAGEMKALGDHAAANKSQKLAVVSHGWRNDENDADGLYTELFTRVAQRLKALGAPAGATTVVGVYWRSMALPEFDGPARSGGAGHAASASAPPADKSKLEARIKALGDAFGGAAQLEEARALLEKLENQESARRRFVELLRQSAPKPSDASEDASDRFFSKDPEVIFDAFLAPVRVRPPADGTGRAQGVNDDSGAAAGVLDQAAGAVGAAFRLVNYLTYYQMKERAGVIGVGLNKALGSIRAADGDAKRAIHLIGHSFGARVVTAAASLGANISPASLTLLQGAFSHNGFASANAWKRDGFFRALMREKRVRGPIVDTYTANDRAVGFAYPLASRLAGDNASAIGDANDEYGGIGRNGALHLEPGETASAKVLLAPGGAYSFEPGRAHNLLADAFISDHGDVRSEAVANVVAQVIARG